MPRATVPSASVSHVLASILALVLTSPLVALAGCSDSKSDEAPPAMPTATPGTERSIDLDVADEPVARVMSILADAAGLPVVIDPGAQRYALCTRVTILSPSPRPVSALVTLVGDAIRPSGFALTMGAEGLVLRHDGTVVPVGCTERTTAFDALPFPAVPAAEDTPSADTSGTPTAADTFAAHVREVRDGEYLVVRSAIDAAFADQNALMRTARIIPHEVNGRVVGIKVYGVRRQSPLGVLGIQNGDTVRTINGYALSDPSAALEAYARLRGATRVEVELERRGAARTLVYRIVDSLPASGGAARSPSTMTAPEATDATR